MTSGRAAPTKTDPPPTGDGAGQAIMEQAGMEQAGMEQAGMEHVGKQRAGMAYAERDTGAL